MLLWLLLLFISACSTRGDLSTKEISKSQDTKEVAKPRTFTGVIVRNEVSRFSPPLAHNVRSGIVVEAVIPHFSGWKAGVRPSDVILNEPDLEVFLNKLNYTPLGDSISIKVLSGKQIKNLSILPSPRSLSYGNTYYPKQLEFSLLPQKTFELESDMSAFKDNDLLSKFDLISEKGDRLRPAALHYVQRNPLSIQEASQEMLKILRECRDVSCLSKITGYPLNDHGQIARPANSIEAHLEFLDKVIIQSKKLNNTAFKDLSSQEKLFLQNNIDEVSKHFKTNLNLHEDSNPNRKKRFYQFAEILEKIDLSKFQESLSFLTHHLNEEYLSSLKILLSTYKKFPITKNTSHGKIIIAGPGPDNHTDLSNQKAILIVDLGGDDIYSKNKGIILDLAGNDRYESTKDWAYSGAKLTTNMLLDISGDDVYNCKDHCLAASFLGASYFADLNGDDTYISKAYSQGASFAGISFFHDDSGNDQYTSDGLSQGVAIAGGSTLFIDSSGNDTYKSRGLRPSSYDDPGQMESWSQGVAIGLRYFLSGGIAVLYDKSGSDTFAAGAFSQGGGYHFGWGLLLNDGTENDSYRGMRYCQGFSLHSAIGSFIEVGGDDLYSTPPPVVSSGIAWDLSISYFEDKSGRDGYTAGGKSLGSASQSSYAFFFDRSGDDIYKNADVVPSEPNPNDYHGGKSLGYFLDSSHSKDSYLNFKNNSCQKTEGISVLCDE